MKERGLERVSGEVGREGGREGTACERGRDSCSPARSPVVLSPAPSLLLPPSQALCLCVCVCELGSIAGLAAQSCPRQQQAGRHGQLTHTR